jgi:hypothetical protein
MVETRRTGAITSSRLPVRQWVLSLPKRLGYFLRHNARTVAAVLNIFLRVIEQRLRECSPRNAVTRREGVALAARVNALGYAQNTVFGEDGSTILRPTDEGPLRAEAKRLSEFCSLLAATRAFSSCKVSQLTEAKHFLAEAETNRRFRFFRKAKPKHQGFERLQRRSASRPRPVIRSGSAQRPLHTAMWNST